MVFLWWSFPNYIWISGTIQFETYHLVVCEQVITYGSTPLSTRLNTDMEPKVCHFQIQKTFFWTSFFELLGFPRVIGWQKSMVHIPYTHLVLVHHGYQPVRQGDELSSRPRQTLRWSKEIRWSCGCIFQIIHDKMEKMDELTVFLLLSDDPWRHDFCTYRHLPDNQTWFTGKSPIWDDIPIETSIWVRGFPTCYHVFPI